MTDACALAKRLGPSAAFLAGGTELLPDYQRGRENAVDLIALRDIGELHGIAIDNDFLCIGSLTTVAELAHSPLVEEWSPVLSEAARVLGSPQIRSRATIGGNFCRAVSCADLPPAALVCDATLRLASATATRDVAASDFFVGARKTVLQLGELLVSVRVPRPRARCGMSFERFGLRRGLALAVASVAARIEMDGGRITAAAAALGAVAPTPVSVPDLGFLLNGQRPSSALFSRAAAACVDAARPIGDVRGSAQFRREIIAVLARRAFATAAARATAEGLSS